MTTPDSGCRDDCNAKFGKILSHPTPGEEVVISGISGSFPNSNNMDELKENLWNKVDMVTAEERRWTHNHPEMPERAGMLKEIDKFDNGFFGVHQRDVPLLFPGARIFMEKAVESIFDAGLNPVDLAGTKTSIFLGMCNNEFEPQWFFHDLISGYGAIAGNLKSVTIDRISHFLKLRGICRITDTACNSSACAIDQAYRSIRTGESDMAIVIGASLCVHPYLTLQFARLGVLAKDGYTRVFDEKGSGYTRSETIAAIFMQKAKDSKRIYAQIVHSKSNSDGYKEQGITYPSGKDQKILLSEVYSEAGIDPSDLSYLEAHGTGTVAGDPEELISAADFFLKSRKTPLLVGSIKSNIGHTEQSSGICSLAKVLLTFENNTIPPNLHFETPRKTITALHDGRMKVVTENTPLPDKNGLIGANNFGFGGSNTHIIFKWNEKVKLDHGKPVDDLSRLVCVSGRTEHAINLLLDDIVDKFDYEHIGLMHNIFRKDVPNHLFRGFSVVSKKGEIKRAVRFYSNVHKRSRCYIYFDTSTALLSTLAANLLKLPILNSLKNRLDNYLVKENVSLQDFLQCEAKSRLNKILKTLISYAIIIEITEKLGIHGTFFVGKSLQNFADGHLKDVVNLGEYLGCNYIMAPSGKNVSFNGKDKNKTRLFFHEDQSVAFSNMQANSIVFNFSSTVISAVKLNRSQLVSVDHGLGFDGFLIALGRLYELGITTDIHQLYPKIDFPVSRGTPMISSKIAWAHHRTQYVQSYMNIIVVESMNKTVKTVNKYKISSELHEWAYLIGHTIDGKDLFPATGYLFLAWDTLSNVLGIDLNQFKVKFENCKFKRACSVPKTLPYLALELMYQPHSAKFEITEGGVPVVTGVLKRMQDNEKTPIKIKKEFHKNGLKPLNSRDIYKELRLRGYHYSGLFKGLKKFDAKEATGKIQWAENWVTFMDVMLQTKILLEDTRQLFVPTGIREMIIDPVLHYECINKLSANNENIELEVNVNLESQIISSGGVHIQGLQATSISRRKYTSHPVLEKYGFVPNEGTLDVESALRVFLQIALENGCGFNVKVAEVVDDAVIENVKIISPTIKSALEDQPSVQCDITVLSSKPLDVDVKVEHQKLSEITDCNLVILSNLSQPPKAINEALAATVSDGYIISRECLKWNPRTFKSTSLTLLNVYSDNQEQLVLFRKVVAPLKPDNTVYLNISVNDQEFTWLTKLQNLLKTNLDVVVYTQNEPLSGILGLINCIKREPECENVRMVFIMDKLITFDPKIEFFNTQLKKGMSINVLKDGKWGTYRHLLLSKINEVKTRHAYANPTIRGDLSSIKWMEGSLSQNMLLESNDVLVQVHYSALNFRDVMTASGRISANCHRKDQDCVEGLEYSGKTTSGRRVMGMVSQGALATLLTADEGLLWDVPEKWSLEEAATVPVVYATCLYALVEVGQIKPKSSVLIHSGTGGIGQAAINLCLAMNCTVFTTVGTQEKREYMRKTFPQVDEKHIGNSRDISFQTQILKETKGKGVDLVLNSLAEEKLFASIRCLAKNGKLLEIGKFDLANDNQMSLIPFHRGLSYHGVMLDKLFNEPLKVKKSLQDLLQFYIDSGAVKPLPTNVFSQNEIEQAFRFMSTGKHMGKVLIRIREENDDAELEFKGVPRFFCNPKSSYIICGGLGGFGLELADWMILRRAKNLILTSRKGITTGYQSYRISIWKSYGCNIVISTEDITTEAGCKALLEKATSLAPVEGIFNLAVILQDAVLENQTAQSFKTSFGPKALATAHLDKLSRELCPQLKEFIVFSSVSCGRGNAGQTNYGMSNSVMERICEMRRSEGLPALAIQWGAIGDVGLVAELQEDHIELAIGGTLQQSISNCLQCMDILLRQKESAIVSSMVVAEKKSATKWGNIFDSVMGILGVTDIKTVSQQSTLAELGMDSMNAVEIKQTLERDFGIFLTPAQIRNLSFAGLKELEESREEKIAKNVKVQFDLFDMVGADLDSKVLYKPVVKLITKNNNEDANAPKIIALPGIEGTSGFLQKLASLLDADVYCLQYFCLERQDTVADMAHSLYKHTTALLADMKTFHLVAHSFGVVLALELVKLLEENGYSGTLTCIDGSPDLLKKVLGDTIGFDGTDTATALVNLQNKTIEVHLRLQLEEKEVAKYMEKIRGCPDFESKLNLIKSWIDSTKHLAERIKDSYVRAKAVFMYNPKIKDLKSKIILNKPSQSSGQSDSEDYGLGRYFQQKVEMKEYTGDHITILKNEKMADDLMEIIKTYKVTVNGNH